MMRRWTPLLALTLLACGGGEVVTTDETTSTGGSSAEAAPAAPRPEDVPQVGDYSVGLAGATPPDVVRYLLVRSAWSPRLSPDGNDVYYRTDVTGHPQLWRVPSAGGAPSQLTFGPSVTFHALSPTGEWLLYGTDRGGNEREGFYLIRPDGTEERELLAPSEAFRSFGGFSRDGRRIAYATTPEGSVSFDVHVMDLETRDDRRVFEGRLGFYVAAWRPDGGALVIGETRGEDANDLHLLDLESGELSPLFTPEDDPSSFEGVEWKPDSSGFYVITDQGRDFAGLAYVDASTRELRYEVTPERDVEHVALSHDGRFLAWTENDGGRSALHVRDLESEDDAELTVPSALPEGGRSMGFADDSHTMSVEVASPRVPGDIWVWDLDSGALSRATRSSLAGLDVSRLVEPTHESFEASDGETIHGLLYMPAGVENPPVLVHVHGGPTAQARPRFRGTQQYLLARGIAIFALNFRGSTGYGKRYARLDNGRLRPNAVRDVSDALDWLESDGRVDASRAAIMGGSYGGYLTFAALVEYPTRFRGGVSFVGVSNWVTALEAASPELRASDRLEYGDIEDPEDRAFFAELSPIRRVSRVQTPMLVSHGANDPRDPVTESDRFVIGAREAGAEVEYVRFEDEGHGVRHLRNRVYLYRRVAAFLERVLE